MMDLVLYLEDEWKTEERRCDMSEKSMVLTGFTCKVGTRMELCGHARSGQAEQPGILGRAADLGNNEERTQ